MKKIPGPDSFTAGFYQGLWKEICKVLLWKREAQAGVTAQRWSTCLAARDPVLGPVLPLFPYKKVNSAFPNLEGYD